MTINRYRYYLGPDGLLQALPGFPGGSRPEAVLTLPAANHMSLAGQTTQDRIATVGQGVRARRVWKMAWEHLTEDEETLIQAAYRLSAQSALRLYDPRKRNSLPEDVSTGGASSMSVAAFTDVGAATPVWTNGGGPVELLGIVAGRIVWNSVTNTQTLYATAEKHPIFSGTFGATYRVSAYVKNSATFRFSARPFDLLGAEQTTVTDATNNASSAGAWVRRSWLYTPLSGVTSAYFGLTATGSGNIETTGWMVQTDDTLRNWTFGYGCPQVVVDPDAGANYWIGPKYHEIQLVLREV